MTQEEMEPLRRFCARLTQLVEGGDRPGLPAAVEAELGRLVGARGWLAAAWAAADPQRYQQHLLYLDPKDRFSVVSFVWGPGQGTPIHDHGIWGVVAVYDGAERSQHYVLGDDAVPVPVGEPRLLSPGDAEILSPEAGDIHRVSNALKDAVTISIHVYGTNIGAWSRRVFEADGRIKPFVSGYSDQPAMLGSLDSPVGASA